MIKASDVLRQAKKELEGVPEGRNFPKYVAINWVCDTIRTSLVMDAQRFLKEANEDFDRAIALAEKVEDEGSKVIQMKVELLDEILACQNFGQIFPILKRAHESALKAQKEVSGRKVKPR